MAANTTRKYKDTVFSSLFYSCDNAVENAKDLYKALTGRTVQHAEKCRLEDALFYEFKNDVAYIMDGKWVCFIEHQSTINPNMPLRCLVYAARTYERSSISDDKLLYSSRLIPVPAPEFYVLYNGTAPLTETHLRLSDAFIESTDKPNMELLVEVLDINHDRLKNTALEKCRSLYEYSYLIDRIRSYKGDVEAAVNECVKQGILADYLAYYGSEVINMLFTEYDADKAIQIRSQEEYERGIEEGRAEGEAKGRAEGEAKGRAEGEAKGVSGMLKKLQKLGKTVKQLSEMFDMPEAEVERFLAMS